MPRKNFLTLQEALALIEASDSDDDEAKEVRESAKVNVIYIPPTVDEASDTEFIDDEAIDQNASPQMDIAGGVQVEFDNGNENEQESEPAAKKSKPNEEQLNAQVEPIEPKYKSMSDFGKQTWSKRAAKYTAQPNNVEETSIQSIVMEHGV